ncbi:MAG TPA: SAM-dependent methyltransferase [Pseudonocardiaceae bacterium]|jgi:hypothetical protein
MNPQQPSPSRRSDDALKSAASEFSPPTVCTCCISTARVSDALLGGGDSWGLDRTFVMRAAATLPGFREMYLEERAFRDRAVGIAVERGIRQFLDIGSGLPFAGALHQILPDVSGNRVMYADLNAVVAARLLIEIEPFPGVGSVHGDLLVPGTILFAEQTQQILDFEEPICLVLTGILDSIEDDATLSEALRCYTDRMAPGSLLIASHASIDGLDSDAAHRDLARQMVQVCESYWDTHVPARVLRGDRDLRRLLGDLVLLDPGIVSTRAWRNPAGPSGEAPTPSLCLAAVAEVTR